MLSIYLIFFFFKQKTAYEMRISDWSSDVCSSDRAVAVPERELRQVAPGERRLLAGDRVQCDFRHGDDLLAVLARDPGMVLDPLGLKPLFGHPRRRRPALVLGFKVDALRLQRPVIYAGVYIQLGHTHVDIIESGSASWGESGCE